MKSCTDIVNNYSMIYVTNHLRLIFQKNWFEFIAHLGLVQGNELDLKDLSLE